MNTNTVDPEALRRPVEGSVVAGVAAGLARYLGVDVMMGIDMGRIASNQLPEALELSAE